MSVSHPWLQAPRYNWPSRRTYYALAEVGKVSLRLSLDTASADLWLVSSACTSSACNVPKYPLTFESPTFVSVNSNATVFNVSYADSTSAPSVLLPYRPELMFSR